MRKLLLLIVIGAGGGLLLPQTRERDEWQLETYRCVPMDPWGSNYYYDI